jgi:enamine deaminase RidA (YjgF/YER057c/UK114 family)
MPATTAPSQIFATAKSDSPPAAASAREHAYSEAARPGESPALVLQRLARRLREDRATLIGLMLFGSLAARPASEHALESTLGEARWPVLWIEGASCEDAELAGVQAFALSGGSVQPVMLDGRVVASRYLLGESEFCWVGASFPDDIYAAHDRQTTQAFRSLERALHAAGFTFGDVVRTWCYNHELLAWYDTFNRARSAFYREVAFRTGATPASTGISAANPAGAALVLAGLAVRPGLLRQGARAIGSPLQCPAPAYGSAFSRAMEINTGNRRRLLISGTASIAPGGETVFVGNVKEQIALTMRVIAAILESRGMTWANATRSIAYFKSPGSVREFRNWCDENHWNDPPCITLHCDICRADLLFELELDAED